MADTTWQLEVWRHYLTRRDRQLELAHADGASDVMFCAYCGRMQPWHGRRHRYYWPSTIYAECWPCVIRHHPAKREPWWWRWLAARVRIHWAWFGYRQNWYGIK